MEWQVYLQTSDLSYGLLVFIEVSVRVNLSDTYPLEPFYRNEKRLALGQSFTVFLPGDRFLCLRRSTP